MFWSFRLAREVPQLLHLVMHLYCWPSLFNIFLYLQRGLRSLKKTLDTVQLSLCRKLYGHVKICFQTGIIVNSNYHYNEVDKTKRLLWGKRLVSLYIPCILDYASMWTVGLIYFLDKTSMWTVGLKVFSGLYIYVDCRFISISWSTIPAHNDVYLVQPYVMK